MLTYAVSASRPIQQRIAREPSSLSVTCNTPAGNHGQSIKKFRNDPYINLIDTLFQVQLNSFSKFIYEGWYVNGMHNYVGSSVLFLKRMKWKYRFTRQRKRPMNLSVRETQTSTNIKGNMHYAVYAFDDRIAVACADQNTTTIRFSKSRMCCGRNGLRDFASTKRTKWRPMV